MENGHLFSGILGDFGVVGSREQGAEEKAFWGAGEKGHFSFREQGAKNPLEGPHFYSVGAKKPKHAW